MSADDRDARRVAEAERLSAIGGEPAFDGERAESLGERVYAQLLEAIVTGAIRPGEKIRELELSRRYGVSRGPVRDAIRRLEHYRLVVHTPNVGARVVELSPQVLHETFMVREAMEGLAARLAAENMTDAEIAELGTLLAEHEADIDDPDVFARGDRDLDFHYRIVRGAKNALVSEILGEDLYQLLRLYRYQHRGAPKRGRRVLVEHRRVFEAIADRDGELAEIMMRRHIATARRVLEGRIAKASPDDAATTSTRGETR